MVDYKNEPQKFDIQIREPWDWVMEIIKSESLCPKISWDAERRYRWDGSLWERIIDEPWTADAWWDAQVSSNSEFNLMRHQFRCLEPELN